MAETMAHDREPEEIRSTRVQRESSADPQRPFYVVGIGASAGGLEALEHLFRSMPDNSGMAFVVVQHLSPDFKSMMDELLARWTKMPIHLVQDGMPVVPNRIFLMPARTEVIISNGRLLLSERVPGDELRLPIDQFFRSLARDQGPRSMAVVLSGTGSDGSRGIRDIHAAGGFVVVQSSESAKFDGMPNSALETGIVDAIASPEQIPQKLLRFIQRPMTQAMLDDETGTANPIFQLLHDRYGIDFSHYKPSTVTRRIDRRLQLGGIEKLEDYTVDLHTNRMELEALYHDLLIGVTSFFRDPEAFRYLAEHALSDLIKAANDGGDFRVWVAGCATGEEAYSIAILVHEQMIKHGKSLNIKVFATDVHARSLEIAAAGQYSDDALANITPERLKQYFIQNDGGYRITNELRNLVVFAQHNIIKDAPFTRLDFISCRNLLIYLLPHAQKKALSLFHFGLKTGGILFLGPSESAGDLADEFQQLEKHWKVFRKRRDTRLTADLRLPLPHSGRGGSGLTPAASRAQEERLGYVGELLAETLTQMMPPSVLVNEHLEIVQIFGDTSSFIRLPAGTPSLRLLEMLPEPLRIPVGAALHRAMRERQSVRFHTLADEHHSIDVIVFPIVPTRRFPFHLLVQFEPRQTEPDAAHTPSGVNLTDAAREHVAALESELRSAKENLQATIEELETSNEELQATNEELLASNEELQSTNEELHSVNEELYSVNTEYQKKIEEQTELTQDMNNLLESTEVHTIFLDGNLCVRKFTPRMAEVFNLIPTDIGRKIHGFAHTIACEGLMDKLHQVLNSQVSLEEEVCTAQGDYFLMRILPYKGEGTRSGVVITLVDITVLKVAESRFRNAVEVAPNGMIVVCERGLITLVNSEVERMFGYTEAELIGQPVEMLVTQEKREKHAIFCAEYFRRPTSIRRMGPNAYVWGLAKNGRQIPLDVRVEPVQTPRGTQSIAALVDISEHQKLESSLRVQVRQRDRFLATLSHELRNPMAAILTAASVLDGFADVSAVVAEPAGVIRRQAAKIATLLDDLLDVARVTQGKIKLRRETVDLRELCAEAIEAVQPMRHEHGHELVFHSSEVPIWSHVDRVRFIQVVENLLTNAIKYTPPAGRLIVTLAEEAQQAVVRVRDNGCGIPVGMLDSIFDMFVQSDETLSRSEGGMGVGLTLVRSLVELHEGTVVATSGGVNEGSEFVVRLPLAQPSPPAPVEPQRFRDPKEIRLVLVEDNEDAREMLATLLQQVGYQVLATAPNGHEGLEAITRLRPDVAMLDIGLPGMDGYQLARRIRDEFQKSIRLIALTGYGRDEDHEACIAAGFDCHLVKPVGIAMLNRVLLNAASPDEVT
jgi:two-component system, chemotaxis family, CheB/CheR fusion protein